MGCPSCAASGPRLTCVSCDNIEYCSTECQLTDWIAHRYLCNTFKAFNGEARPSENHRRCIVFPIKGDKPKFTWLEVKEVKDAHGVVQYKQPNVVKLLGTENPSFDTVIKNAITGERLDEHIHVCYHEDAIDRYPDKNAAVELATAGVASSFWRGAIVAYCGLPDIVDSPDADITEVTDMGMLAYSHVIASLIDCHNDQQEYFELEPKGPKVQAVEVFSDAAVARNGGVRCRLQNMPRLHPYMRARGEVGAVSIKVGMPLVCVKLPNPEEKSVGNSLASCINISINPTEKSPQRDNLEELKKIMKGVRITQEQKKAVKQGQTGDAPKEKVQVKMTKLKDDNDPHGRMGFGRASKYWTQKPCGDVLVFRKDCTALSIDTLEAFGAFCKAVEGSITGAAEKGKDLGQGIDEIDQDHKITLQRNVSSEAWKAFLESWNKHKEGVSGR